MMATCAQACCMISGGDEVGEPSLSVVWLPLVVTGW